MSSALNDDPKGSFYATNNDINSGELKSRVENNEMKKRAFVARARQKDLLLAENLLTSRRKSIFRDALTAGVKDSDADSERKKTA